MKTLYPILFMPFFVYSQQYSQSAPNTPIKINNRLHNRVKSLSIVIDYNELRCIKQHIELKKIIHKSHSARYPIKSPDEPQTPPIKKEDDDG